MLKLHLPAAFLRFLRMYGFQAILASVELKEGYATALRRSARA